MELDEIKKLRNQIREMLLNSEDLKSMDSLKDKKDFQQLKKDCYVKLVDLKNDFESTNENMNNEKLIKNINSTIVSLEKIKLKLSNQI